MLLHKLLIDETGGDPNIRDINLLDSAIKNIYKTIDVKDLHPSKDEKAALLGYSLVNNHAFVDGNKRIGMLMMLSFLESNGIKVSFINDEVYDIGLGLTNGKISKDDLYDMLLTHKIL